VGIAAALAAIVAFVGLIDSFLGTIDRGRDELRSSSPDRLEVALDRPYPINSGEVTALAASDAVDAAEPMLRLDSLAINGGEEVGLQLELRALDSTMWRPTITAGDLDREQSGIYLTELAASNLGV